MKSRPVPVVFQPIFKPKPWGGRALARLFDKPLPDEQAIGESWEVCDLPGNESRVATGPVAGKTVGELIKMWGADFVGHAELVDGRFPLLIKFLDARERLSVQVHPRGPARPGEPEPAGVKHEAWYVIDAEQGAALYLGMKGGVRPEDVRRAGATRAIVELLQARPGRRGDCYYLPSGTPHALGAGLVVAEVQTPSDVTYRLYDWGRVGLDGRPRELHLDQAHANIRYDVNEREVVQPRSHAADVFATVTRLVACERFLVDKLRVCEGVVRGLPHAEMVIWIVLRGVGGLVRGDFRCGFRPGDVVVIPAVADGIRLETASDCEMLEVKIPIRSSLTGYPHRRPEPPPRPGGPVPLTRGGQALEMPGESRRPGRADENDRVS